MADNTTIRNATGSSTTVAADDVGGVLYQRVKVAIGTDGVAADVNATNRLPVTAGVAPPLGYGQVAALTTSAALPTIPANSVTALVVPRAPIRWRDDGGTPTASVGMYLAADQPLTYQGSLSAFRMVAVSGSVEVNVAFYGAAA